MALNPDRAHFGIIAGSLITAALALYYGTGLHPTWWLTWLAPLPLLLIVPRLSLWQSFGVSVLASFAGGLNMWHYFRHAAEVPLVFTVIFLLLPACVFALGVLLFRLCALRGSLLQAAIVYPAFWVSFEFLTASISPHSTYGNLAYNQMNFLPIVQIASVTGIWGISFCVLLFPATIAAICVVPGQAHPKKLLAASVGVLLLAVLSFGAWRLHVTPPAQPVSVALIASDLPENMLPTTQEDSLRLFRDYAAQAHALSRQHFQALVLPEKIAVVQESYLSQVDSLFSETASRTGAVVVVGLIRHDSNGLWNEARIYTPARTPPLTYEKHHMLPPFESQFTVGTSRTILRQPSGLWGITICKDMDFPLLSRQYGLEGTGILLVPAWDFDSDGWLHGRMAILRGVEDGFSIARAPRHGILSISDDRGRILAERSTNSQPFVTLLAQMPVQHDSTLYSRWGNWFAWLCVLLFFWSFLSAVKFRIGTASATVREAASSAAFFPTRTQTDRVRRFVRLPAFLKYPTIPQLVLKPLDSEAFGEMTPATEGYAAEVSKLTTECVFKRLEWCRRGESEFGVRLIRRNLFILLKAKNARNTGFAQVSYILGTRTKVRRVVNCKGFEAWKAAKVKTNIIPGFLLPRSVRFVSLPRSKCDP